MEQALTSGSARAVRSEHDRLLANRALLRGWLYVILLMIFALVLVGGATRLTDSGLSITEWKPIHGVIPPLNDAEWQEEFAKYQQIPEYTEINQGMTLQEFKRIFWWEWAHRILARGVGFVFALPLLFFLATGRVERGLSPKLIGLLLLGGLQGAVGWWMVASGLVERVDVSQYRLATHLTLACIIFVAVVWVATTLLPRKLPAGGRRAFGLVLIALSLVQVFLGAIVAKTGAGLTFNTWPLIDGRFVPALEQLFAASPWWRNAFENVLAVQFNHRIGAYVLWIAALGYALWPKRRTASREALKLFVLISAQAALGIVTLLYAVPLALGLAHQAGAVVVLAYASYHTAKLT
jgi:cytochrome c oxidase assembly protein subunit 15